MIKKFPILCSDIECTGCMACYNACPKGALQQKQNKDGFYRPVLDESKCTKCGLCEKSCPILSDYPRFNITESDVYAGWHIDIDIRYKTSSGGAFSALAESVIIKGGVVIGAAYSGDMSIEHIAIDCLDEIDRLRLSKYAQSRIGNIYIKVLEYLNAGKIVLFVGTPCQVAGLRAFLKKDFNKLICCDLICHGVPSIEFLHTYLKWLEPKMGKVFHINFREKSKGWYDSLRMVTTESQNTKLIKGRNDSYWIACNRNNCLQESCYQCKAQGWMRYGDITLADFWKIGHKLPFGHNDDIEKGVSMIIVNNPRIQWLIEESRRHLFLEKRSLEEALGGNKAGIESSARPESRDTFYYDLKVMYFEAFRKKYMLPTKKEYAVKFFRERLPFWFIKQIRLAKQK